jgi:hypothetical protein
MNSFLSRIKRGPVAALSVLMLVISMFMGPLPATADTADYASQAMTDPQNLAAQASNQETENHDRGYQQSHKRRLCQYS